MLLPFYTPISKVYECPLLCFLSQSVQLLSHVWLFATPWTAACQASLSITISQSLLKLMSIESVMPSNHLILCCPLLLLSSIFPSIRIFSNESLLCIRQPKYWSLSFNISPSNEHPGLISFGMDWLYLLAVQGTLKSPLQHHSSKASVLWRSAFFIVQLSHPYLTTGKTITLTRPTFVGKVMSLLFNMLSRLVIAFLPRSKHLLVSWAVTICSDFGAQKNKVSRRTGHGGEFWQNVVHWRREWQTTSVFLPWELHEQYEKALHPYQYFNIVSLFLILAILVAM